MEEILSRAKSDLLLPIGQGAHDVILWEHAKRIAASVEWILEVLKDRSKRVDRSAMQVAALYYSSGWAVQFHDGQVNRFEILGRPLTDIQREIGAAKALQSLEDVLPQKTLSLACTIIRQSGMHHTSDLGAQILSEAVNLDLIGPVSFWYSVRRLSNEGRGIEACLEIWKRQIEYNYWAARISESFRFESVRAVARHRLRDLEQLMEALGRHVRQEDLTDASRNNFDPSYSSASTC